MKKNDDDDDDDDDEEAAEINLNDLSIKDDIGELNDSVSFYIDTI